MLGEDYIDDKAHWTTEVCAKLPDRIFEQITPRLNPDKRIIVGLQNAMRNTVFFLIATPIFFTSPIVKPLSSLLGAISRKK